MTKSLRYYKRNRLKHIYKDRNNAQSVFICSWRHLYLVCDWLDLTAFFYPPFHVSVGPYLRLVGVLISGKMSEDEVKPQAEEPSPEPIKTDGVEEDKKTEEKVEEKANDKADDEQKGKTEEATSEKMDTDEKKEVPKPKTEASVPEETKTPEKAVPLYDQPLEMSGKRDRKKVERFIQEEKKEELKFEGSGTPLGDIPFIEFMLKKTHQDELKVLHRVAYGRPGSGVEIKKNLRKFNGFGFTKEDKKFEGKSLSLEKVTKAEITKILKILGMEVGGSKREIVDRFMDFMLEPKDMGRKPPKIKVGKGRGRPKRDHNQSKNTSTESYSEDEGGSDEGNEDEENDEETTKKRKKTPAKKTPAKKTPAKKPSAKKSAAKTQANVAKTVSSDSDSESDDEPLAKKAKHPPSDSEIKAMVKKILDGANLEEVTMKSVCRQVYDSYPDFDLTHKKDFIKETVKSIIS